MLATLTSERFSSKDWIFERKLDGERCLAFCRNDGPELLSRNRKGLNGSYPELVEVLAGQPARRFIVDGEIVAFEGKLTSFSRLQGRIGKSDPTAARKSNIKVYYYLFDLLYLDDYSVDRLPLRERKNLLRRRFAFTGPLRFTPHRNADGEAVFADACRRGWEGLIAKRADAPYVHDRSRDWLKFKCAHGQELVICGYTEPSGTRVGFGALLLGYYEGGSLRYAGKVGTGFDEPTLESLAGRLERLERDESPYAGAPHVGGTPHWVEPELVAEIGFTEWTRSGRLRHPRFLGLRRDKSARNVHRERP